MVQWLRLHVPIVLLLGSAEQTPKGRFVLFSNLLGKHYHTGSGEVTEKKRMDIKKGEIFKREDN